MRQAFQIVECLPLFECTLLILVAVTALRISEALGLRRSDIDWTKLLIHVRRARKYGRLGEPKSKASKASKVAQTDPSPYKKSIRLC